MTTKQKLALLWQNKWINNGIWLIGFVIIYLMLRPLMQGDVVRDTAPHFSATSLSGEQLDLSDFQGEAVLIHFWATWCPICEFSRDGIERIAQDYRVISVATQSGDNATLIAYAQQHNMNPALIVNDENGQLFNLYGARAVPADFIINAQGEVAFVEVGLSSSWGMRARLWWANR
ncbi:protein disulfide oxidoreductase [Thiomicrospira microaerophila]|uniref:protein disulfide oxidoreductase n=1 Tax=Thiomicrospira microaerophila TaxID=406020 RepID=UPI00200D1593|nr:protein disulfide oxidoreductase [Thiomicrospira microaerophila]UQB41502.1 protein disulfide oxidoreductase [Thiomicrospira microaerophila]